MSDSIINRQALIDAFECLDLIDRQAATKSLVRPRVIDPYDQYWTGRNDQYDADVFALKDLPSAQSERKWIPCSERLPEEKQDVLVSMWNRAVVVAYREDDSWKMNEGFRLADFDVLAWVPLPEPYKEGKE